MCGIAGFIGDLKEKEMLHFEIKKMTDKLHHRGPDEEGCWFDSSIGLALGHRRLSVLDLSETGSQPMVSSSGRYVILLNGEIYNYRSIKAELTTLGYHFKGTSDSEVLIEAVAEWGFEKALGNAAGMFAVAVYDRSDRVLYLARDRIGEKPLYYGNNGHTFYFSSELKAIAALSFFSSKLDLDAISLYFRHSYIPAPHTIYKNVKKLEPGCYLRVKLAEKNIELDEKKYWSLKKVIEAGKDDILNYGNQELINSFDTLLKSVVEEQMAADVPLGAFLSGGIDSSLIVSTMQSLTSKPIKTFTIGFDESDYDEAIYAGKIAKYLGTEHNDLIVGSQEALKLALEVPDYYDEPFADSSQLPTCLVAQLARQHVTVSLSGDGGDELFAGYNNYAWAENIWHKTKNLPAAFKKASSAFADYAPVELLDLMLKVLSPLIGQGVPLNGDRLKKHAGLIKAASREDFYRSMVSSFSCPSELVLGATEPDTIYNKEMDWPDTELTYTEWMMYIDAMQYLPDDILVKLDRAAMAVSLESRVPLLDYRIIEFAWRLPFTVKVHNNERKWILKQLLYKNIPEEYFARAKKGFSVPIADWLRGPLRSWADDLLSSSRIKSDGILNGEIIQRRWKEHLSGKRDWQQSLWTVLMFQSWLDKNNYSR